MAAPKPDHFHLNIRAVPMIDPANAAIGTLIFRLETGQHYFSMSRQALEQLVQEMRVELERAPLPAR